MRLAHWEAHDRDDYLGNKVYQRENLEWRQVPGEEYYYVSNYGDVVELEHINVGPKGRHIYHPQHVYWSEEQTLRKNAQGQGKYKEVKVHGRSIGAHRVAALAFIPNPQNKPQVNHIDGNGFNNYCGCKVHDYTDSNLEWVTQQENTIHAYTHNLIPRGTEAQKIASKQNIQAALRACPRYPVVQLDLMGNYINEFPNSYDAAKATGINAVDIWAVCHHNPHSKSAGHYIWVFKEEYEANPNQIYEYKVDSKRPVLQYDLHNNFIAEYSSATEACRVNGFGNRYSMIQVCQGKKDKYKNYIWRYKDSA